MRLTPNEILERELRALDARLYPPPDPDRLIKRDATFMLCVVLVGLGLIGQALFFSPVGAQVRLRFVGPVPVVVGDNPISAARLPAGDVTVPNGTWSTAGRTDGIPTALERPRCTTGTAAAGDLAASSTAAQINTAITGCDADHAVILASGAFTLSAGINLSTTNVTLRGQGAGTTTLDINGSTGCSGIFFVAAVRICGDTNTGCTASCGGGSGPDHSATWSTGYAQGTTSITLSAVTGLVVGQTLYLDQNNHNTDGYPAAGDTFFCEGTSPCSAEGSGAAYYRDGKSQVEYHQVVGCRNGSGETAGAVCTSTTVVISPGVLNPTIRSGQSPGAWWNNSDLVGPGLEDLSIDFTGQNVGVELFNVKEAYVRGVRIITTAGATAQYHLLPIQTTHSTFESNYFYGPITQGNTQYAYTPTGSGQLLFQNNILHFNVTPIAPNDPDSGSVYGYNYVLQAFYSSYGPQHHNTGDMYNLHEGNNYGNVTLDINHGPHHFQTYFRNFLNGAVSQVSAVYEAGAMFAVNSRFINMVGNVIGGTSSGYGTYENNLGLPAGNEVYVLGTRTPCSLCGPLTPDSNVKRTLFRWGNYDSVTGSTKWCAGLPLPSNCGTGAGGIGTPQNEVPSTITNYPNAVPASQTLPTSLYLSAKPSWFQSITWPPIGPDVTGGPSLGVGGHAYLIPARVCFASLSDDAAFPSSNPRIKSFNRVTCYGA